MTRTPEEIATGLTEAERSAIRCARPQVSGGVRVPFMYAGKTMRAFTYKELIA